MPARFVIHPEQHLVISIGWDRVTCDEVLAHRDQLVSNPDFDPDFDQLVDGRAVTELEISVEEAKTIAGRSLFSAKSRRAFVASGLAILGMARLVETYSHLATGNKQIRVFHDLPTALKWLGLERLPE